MAEEKTGDAALDRLRALLATNDLALLDSVNRRLDLVHEIKQRKEELGVSFVDREREAWLLDHLQRANNGRLSEEGLREFFTRVLELTKRELTAE
jgi:chorismate mutase